MTTALCVHRPEISADPARDLADMAAIVQRLGYDQAVTIAIDPELAGPVTTLLTAIGKRRPDAVVVPDLGHVDGIDHLIRSRGTLITVTPERILEQLPSKAAAA